MSQLATVPMRWTRPRSVAAARVRSLSEDTGLPIDVCRILVRRGIDTPAAVRTFLRPDLTSLHDPYELPDMEAATVRIEAAVAGGETILVHGDYDADGMSAAALLTLGLRRLGAQVRTFVPHRTRDGYDLSEAGLERARQVGASLVLTADCGVTALDSVERARQAGLDVVVTDHHRPGERLPGATAVVNPMRSDSTYPFAGLAGVGVAFKLITALFRRTGVPDPELYQHLDLVALGTIADQMPLLSENRALVRAGLKALARSRKPGLRALLARAGVPSGTAVEAEHVAFRLAPRLNSVGRMAEADAGFRLLVTEDADEARRLATHLDEQNSRRRTADRRVFAEVEALLETRFDAAADRVVVLWGEGWHPGVIGIAAARVVERVHRPAVVVTFDGEIGRGSGRSIDRFHLFNALRECDAFLERYGGHRMAAGLTIRKSRIEEFASRLRAVADRELGSADLGEELQLDLELPLADVTADLHRWLGYVGPFGVGNPAPVLAVRNVAMSRPVRVGPDGRHLRSELSDGVGRLPAIGFGLGARLPEITSSRGWDVAFELSENRWNGRSELQARVLDFRAREE